MQIIGNADLEYLTEKSKAFATRCMKEPCNSLDLLQGIVDLVDVQSETQTHANLLLNRLTQKEPELLCLGLSSIQVRRLMVTSSVLQPYIKISFFSLRRILSSRDSVCV